MRSTMHLRPHLRVAPVVSAVVWFGLGVGLAAAVIGPGPKIVTPNSGVTVFGTAWNNANGGTSTLNLRSRTDRPLSEPLTISIQDDQSNTIPVTSLTPAACATNPNNDTISVAFAADGTSDCRLSVPQNGNSDWTAYFVQGARAVNVLAGSPGTQYISSSLALNAD